MTADETSQLPGAPADGEAMNTTAPPIKIYGDSEPESRPSMSTPKGPMQARWFAAGYQSALADIAAALERGGEDAALTWIANNRTTAETRPQNASASPEVGR